MGPGAIAGMQAGEGIAGSLISWWANSRMQKKAQRYAHNEALAAYQRDVDMWNRTNEYNSPLEKRKRLEEAGISPWAEYGQMSSDANSIKSPVAETIAPARFDLPSTNAISTYLAVKRQNADLKAIQSSLERQDLEKQYKKLEIDVLQAYKDRQMLNDLTFAQDLQSEQRIQWNRLQELHEERVAEYHREKEKFDHEKGLWKYDDKFKKLELIKQEKGLLQMEADLREMALRAEDLKQKYQIGEEAIKKAKQDFEISAKKEESDAYFRGERKKMYDDTGIDMEKDPWYLRKAGEVDKWIDKKISEGLWDRPAWKGYKPPMGPIRHVIPGL